MELTSEELCGFAVLFGAASKAFAFGPAPEVLGEVAAVARAAGADEVAQAADDLARDPSARQRYYDRFAVPSAGSFVSLEEGRVRNAYVEEGRIHYGAATTAAVTHVLGCYEAVGFNWRTVEACAVSKAGLQPDSLAVELAFLSALAAQAGGALDAPGVLGAPGMPGAPSAPDMPDTPGILGAPGVPDAPDVPGALSEPDASDAPGAGASDEQVRATCERLLRQFAREHANRWFGRAAEHLALSGDDLYARLCVLVAQAVACLAE